MRIDTLLEASNSLALPCFDLYPAAKGDTIAAHWGGLRSDLPEKFPEFVGAFTSLRHLVSVDQILFDRLGLEGRAPLALALLTTADHSEVVEAYPVPKQSFGSIEFTGGTALTAKPAISVPPLEAVLLYGGAPAEAWLAQHGLQRWQYAEIPQDVIDAYSDHFERQHPLFIENSAYARVGGWHIQWPDDDFFIPREMRLMLWTFQDSEPWYEVFLSPQKNFVVKSRRT